MQNISQIKLKGRTPSFFSVFPVLWTCITTFIWCFSISLTIRPSLVEMWMLNFLCMHNNCSVLFTGSHWWVYTTDMQENWKIHIPQFLLVKLMQCQLFCFSYSSACWTPYLMDPFIWSTDFHWSTDFLMSVVYIKGTNLLAISSHDLFKKAGFSPTGRRD